MLTVAPLCVGRADNWLVDTGSHAVENGGLTAFGKVRWLQSMERHSCFGTLTVPLT